MLMIAISIVSHRMSNSFAEPRQLSLPLAYLQV